MADDLESERLEIVKEALRHTELYLKGLEDLAVNADRRSVSFFAGGLTLAGFLITSATYFPSTKTNLIAAVMCIVASGLSISSIRPKRFHILGHRWEDWKGHLEEGNRFIAVLRSQAEENDQRIIHNFNVLERSAQRFWWSVWLFIATAVTVLLWQTLSYYEYFPYDVPRTPEVSGDQ